MQPVPRLMLDRYARSLHQIDGRRVQPLWVYDSTRYAFEDSSWPWGLIKMFDRGKRHWVTYWRPARYYRRAHGALG